MKKLDIYLAGIALLAVGMYLHSPAVSLGSVLLWGCAVAESVFTQKNKDAEIVALILRMEKLEKEHKGLSMDISNVAERAKTVLGEVY